MIKIYSTSYCGQCKTAKYLLSKKGIPFTERMIDKSEEAEKEYLELQEKHNLPRLFPTFQKDGKFYTGWGANVIAKLL